MTERSDFDDLRFRGVPDATLARIADTIRTAAGTDHSTFRYPAASSTKNRRRSVHVVDLDGWRYRVVYQATVNKGANSRRIPAQITLVLSAFHIGQETAA